MYDFEKIIEWSIKAQQEVVRAKSILAIARLDRLLNYLEKKSDGQ